MRCYASAMPPCGVCPSARPSVGRSVTFVNSVKTNIAEKFNPLSIGSTNITDRQTDGQTTDGFTTT